MNKMDAGKAWVILEEYFHSSDRRLVSIVSPRKTIEYVCDLMEQMYVAKFASLDERITYKKDRKRSAFRMENYQQRGPTLLWCGQEPTFHAYRCHRLQVKGNTLFFWYYGTFQNSNERRNEFEGSVDVT